MRDCPTCRVPLHGYEQVCPSCGTQQIPVSGSSGGSPYGTQWKPQEPKINMLPVILVVAGLLISFGLVASNTWVGQVMAGKNKPPADPLNNMTYLQARDAIDSTLAQGLQSAGATKYKIIWKSPNGGSGKPEERAADAPVDVTVDTALPAADSHKQVIEPVKQYMDRAKVNSLTMTDSRSHATWTYNLSESGPASSDDSGQ